MSFITPLTQQVRLYNYRQSVTNSTAVFQTTVIDMTGWESITLLSGRATTNTDTSNGLFFETGTASDAMSQVTGIQNISMTGLYLEMVRPNKRYVRGNFLSCSSGADVQTVWAILSGAKNLPATNPASTTGKVLYSPGSGTATG